MVGGSSGLLCSDDLTSHPSQGLAQQVERLQSRPGDFQRGNWAMWGTCRQEPPRDGEQRQSE